MKQRVKPGGAIIFFDKCGTGAGYEGTVLVRLTWNKELQSGARSEDVTEKEMRLISVQKPVALEEIAPAVEVFRIAVFTEWIISP